MTSNFPDNPSDHSPDAAASSTDHHAETPGQVPSDGTPSSDDFSENQPTVISKRPRRTSRDYQPTSSSAELGAELEGQLLDYFLLEEFVGGGGMGAVFRATDTKLGRTVAVKVLSPYLTDEANLRRFKNEAQTAARLDHANIARVYYVGEDATWHFIVFEFIEGVNLRDLVNRKGPLSIQEAVTYTLQAAAALEHAAQRDLVHRDIKPSNVLITPEGQAKLVDMGLARLHHMETNSADLTASGVTLGTFDYISPEQARDPRNADVRSDLYSLGCTLYYMLTGMPPFPGGTVLQKLLSHSSEAPAELGSFRDDLDPAVITLVDRMLAKQPSERYQTPGELIQDLSNLANKLGMTDLKPGFSHWIEPRRRQDRWIERHLPWAVPLAALVIVVLTLERVTQSRSAISISDPRFSEPVFQQAQREPGAGQRNESTSPANGLSPREEQEVPGNGTNSIAESSSDSTGPTRPPMPDPLIPGSNLPPITTRPAENGDPPQPEVGPPDPDSIHTLVVQPPQQPTPVNAEAVATLEEAIEIAQQTPSVTVIEIAASGSMETRPFMLNLAPERELTIRGREGASPLLVFRPTDFDLETAAPTMIQVSGGNLRFQNVHLRLELPGEFRQSWTFLALQDVARLAFEKGSLTVTNTSASETGSPITGVAFFDLLLPTGNEPGETLDSANSMPTPVPQLILQDIVARGPATLVRTAGAIPFKLRWNNGLIVSNNNLLETVGSETRPRWQDGVIDLELQNITAVVREGLCLMKGSERRPHAVNVMTKCQNCIVITDPGAALYLQRGFTSEESVMLRPQISGASNYYQNTDLVLKVESRDLEDEDLLFTFEFIQTNRNSDLIRPWYHEMNYRPGTMISWKQSQVPPAEIPLAQHTVLDYLLDDQALSLEMEPAGALANELPAIPVPTVLPIPSLQIGLPVPVSPTP